MIKGHITVYSNNCMLDPLPFLVSHAVFWKVIAVLNKGA